MKKVINSWCTGVAVLSFAFMLLFAMSDPTAMDQFYQSKAIALLFGVLSLSSLVINNKINKAYACAYKKLRFYQGSALD